MEGKIRCSNGIWTFFFEKVLKRNSWYVKMLENVAENSKENKNLKNEVRRMYKYHTSALLAPMLSDKGVWKFVVPEELCERVIREAHDSPSNGYFKVVKTFHRIANKYYWGGLLL